MLNQTPEPNQPIWFIDDRGFVRSGRCITSGPALVVLDVGEGKFLVERRLSCFSDEHFALQARVVRLTDEIALREQQRASLLNRLACLSHALRKVHNRP